MDDPIRCAHRLPQIVRAGQIGRDEADVRPLEVGRPAGITNQGHDLVGPRRKPGHEGATDEPGAAGNDDAHVPGGPAARGSRAL